MPKRTFQPNRRHRVKTHGFRARMKTKSGAAVLSRRRADRPQARLSERRLPRLSRFRRIVSAGAGSPEPHHRSGRDPFSLR